MLPGEQCGAIVGNPRQFDAVSLAERGVGTYRSARGRSPLIGAARSPGRAKGGARHPAPIRPRSGPDHARAGDLGRARNGQDHPVAGLGGNERASRLPRSQGSAGQA